MMATEVKVPTTGNAGEPAVLLEWNVAVGDTVSIGDVVAVLETAKATVEVDTPAAGVVLDLRYAEGDEAPEHDVLLVVGAVGEAVSARTPDAAPSAGASVGASAAPDGASDRSPATARAASPAPEQSPPRGRLSISPRARRLAAERDVDIALIEGSGPFGRIVIADVEAADTAPPTPSATAPVPAPATSRAGREGSVVPVRGARKVTAQRMHASLQGTAQVTLTRYASGDALLAYAARLKEAAALTGAARIGVNDLLLFAAARTLARHPAANSWFSWDGITRFDHVDLGFAVDTGQALLVPVIRDAQSLGLGALAEAAHAAIDRARAGRLAPDEMEGGTFTVSNLGGAGIHWFTPVLNTPQTCILGVGATHRAFPEAPAQLPLSLTFDHRAIDGSAAAALLADIASSIELIDTLAAY
ncbi:dihydrolipoamide acetyltransferase family protein [Microbacterium sp. VKM Ac-2923]|uniref:dihydrolipoamide acetyltransferase family protein n=1 Tax=Microbacterium sp. VKM Ac-2923 TaxID=2929476 RepID=UPI001FB49698|nr:dihydrolipoamide acetyltransferase family protein [Microbacterium sp. VKM Ac-2923]MCJ1707802.1 2-oxo acid dehydrogenase subunit E2 [Microbacterium sp. VKM Ac-2923]